MTMLELALAFAEAGFAVFPVRVFWDGERLRKEPHITKWRDRATTDPGLIAQWWAQWPNAKPGIALRDLVVVDADRHPGKPDGVAALPSLVHCRRIRSSQRQLVRANIASSANPIRRFLAIQLSIIVASTCLAIADLSLATTLRHCLQCQSRYCRRYSGPWPRS